MFVQPLHLRIDGSRAHAASDEQIAAVAKLLRRHLDELGRIAQRTREIGQTIALGKGAHLARRHAYGLDDDGDGAVGRIEIGDGERYPLALLVNANDDELPRQSALRHSRSLYPQQPDIFCERSLLYNLKHNKREFLI